MPMNKNIILTSIAALLLCLSCNKFEGDQTVLERDPLEKLADQGELMSYMHRGFWQCMDNVREKELLEKLWANGRAPWKKWED